LISMGIESLLFEDCPFSRLLQGGLPVKSEVISYDPNTVNYMAL